MLISIGFVSKRTGLLKEEHAAVLNNIIIYMTMPALIFRAVSESKISLSLLMIPVLALTISSLCMGIAFVLARPARLKSSTFGALLIASSVGNTGYLGFPLTLQLFGIGHLVKAVFYDLFGTVIFMFTVGLLIAGRFGEGEDKINMIKELITFPPLLGLIAGFILRGFELPGFLADSIEFLSNATIPLIMISIGLSLKVAALGRYKLAIGIVGLVKLGLAPILAVCGAIIFGLNGVDLRIASLEASMPTAMFLMIIGIKYGLDTDFIPAVIVSTTMVSLITIPLWQYVFRMIV